MIFDLVISEGIIVTMEPDEEPFIGSIGVKDGRIETIQKKRMYPSDGKQYIYSKDKIIIPGLINGHCHGDMTVLRGIADDMTLLEQNEKFQPLNFMYDKLSEEDRYYSRQLTYIEALKSGTTFMTENMYWGLGLQSIDAMAETGIKGALAEDIRVNFTNPDQLLSEERVMEFSAECKKNNIVPVLGSISEEDFDETRLRRIFEIAKKDDILVTQHLAETEWRVAMSRKSLNDTPVRALDKLNLLSDRLIGSHGIYIDKEEIQSLLNANAKIINTPVCEMKIADGIAPIPEFLKAGVLTGLGTDGALWNNSNDMFREMKGLILLHSINQGVRQINAKQALTMATKNGASIFDVEDQIGTLREGKAADFSVINTCEPHMRPLRVGKLGNIVSHLVYSVTGRDVESVYINGEPVMLNRKILTIDENEIIDNVQAISDRLVNEIPADAFKM